MSHPLIFQRQSHIIKAPSARRAAVIVTQAATACSHVLWKMPLKIHRNGGIATIIPYFYPLMKGRTSSSMHQHHRRHGLIAFWNTDIGKDSLHLPIEGHAVVEDSSDCSDVMRQVWIRSRHLVDDAIQLVDKRSV